MEKSRIKWLGEARIYCRYTLRILSVLVISSLLYSSAPSYKDNYKTSSPTNSPTTSSTLPTIDIAALLVPGTDITEEKIISLDSGITERLKVYNETPSNSSDSADVSAAGLSGKTNISVVALCANESVSGREISDLEQDMRNAGIGDLGIYFTTGGSISANELGGLCNYANSDPNFASYGDMVAWLLEHRPELLTNSMLMYPGKHNNTYCGLSAFQVNPVEHMDSKGVRRFFLQQAWVNFVITFREDGCGDHVQKMHEFFHAISGSRHTDKEIQSFPAQDVAALQYAQDIYKKNADPCGQGYLKTLLSARYCTSNGGYQYAPSQGVRDAARELRFFMPREDLIQMRTLALVIPGQDIVISGNLRFRTGKQDQITAILESNHNLIGAQAVDMNTGEFNFRILSTDIVTNRYDKVILAPNGIIPARPQYVSLVPTFMQQITGISELNKDNAKVPYCEVEFRWRENTTGREVSQVIPLGNRDRTFQGDQPDKNLYTMQSYRLLVTGTDNQCSQAVVPGIKENSDTANATSDGPYIYYFPFVAKN